MNTQDKNEFKRKATILGFRFLSVLFLIALIMFLMANKSYSQELPKNPTFTEVKTYYKAKYKNDQGVYKVKKRKRKGVKVTIVKQWIPKEWGIAKYEEINSFER